MKSNIFCILSFYKKESAQRSRGRNPNPEAVDRECDISFTQCVSAGNGKGDGDGRVMGKRGEKRCRQTTVCRSSLLGIFPVPISCFRLPRVSSRVICMYQLCFSVTEIIDDIVISPILRFNNFDIQILMFIKILYKQIAISPIENFLYVYNWTKLNYIQLYKLIYQFYLFINKYVYI